MEANTIGHEKQKIFLDKVARANKISHSYLFEGPEGIGKKKIAEEFAKKILCTSPGESPCGICSSCIKFDSRNHPDFKLIEAYNGIIRKSQIDELVEGAWTAPFESSKKIYIIDNSHLMNVESMNGLLKTLEEPPEFMIMILISHRPEELLQTIKSRCQSLSFNPLGEKDLIHYLIENKDIDEKRARFIASLSLGSIMLAEHMLEDENFLDTRNKLIGVIGSLLGGDRKMAYRGYDILMEDDENLNLLLEFMTYWFRDLAIYKETGRTELIINKDYESEIHSQSLNLGFDEINDIIESIGQTKKNIESNVNLDLSLEMMFLNI